MEKEYIIDTLFDLINESDALGAEIQDIHADRDGLNISTKDGVVFKISINPE